MMVQWEALKKSVPQAILLFRLGDFYEAFYEDAVTIAKNLDLTLTKRQEVPMAGVPFHTCENYIDRLVAKGFHVAVAEQMEDARLTKGLVKREIVRIVTPGTLITSSLLPEKANNFLVCVSQLNQLFGLAALDLTTAEFRVMESEDMKELLDELLALRPAEILLSHKFHSDHTKTISYLQSEVGTALTAKDDWHFEHKGALSTLLRHFKVHTLDGFGLKGMLPAIDAAGALLRYVQEDLSLTVSHITQIQVRPLAEFMAIDHATVRHLELFESSSQKGETLLSLLDQTLTPMGGRLLREWLIHPLLSPSKILERQNALRTFLQNSMGMRQLREELSKVRDLERLMMRIETGYATPRDLLALADSLQPTQAIARLLKTFSSPLLSTCLVQLKDPTALCLQIKNALVDEPPLRLNEGGIFKEGYLKELDELRSLKGDSHTWIAEHQTALREKSGIKTLKVGYTRAFGYYIEVSRGQADKLAPFAERKQTLVSTERFITPELKEYELRSLSAEEKIASLECELFHALRKEIAKEAPMVREIAAAIAQVDTLLSLATSAREQNYNPPTVDESDLFQIEEGRHPVLEKVLQGDPFIPNDLLLNGTDSRLVILTGPNMAGKSTFLRQAALIAIMSQMGSFVPAKSAHIGIIDRLFSRIGASDDLSRGQSTFMVEMTETANILHNATNRSLVLLDEIGRGTSTYDGISIAWAVAEHLLHTRCKTLFATHYWELTKLEEQEGVRNAHVSATELKEKIIFLRKVSPGSTDKSYGIHVARIAGLPASAIRRAEEILRSLEGKVQKVTPSVKQMPLFEREATPPPPLIRELKELDPHKLTPLEALLKIAQWKSEIK